MKDRGYSSDKGCRLRVVPVLAWLAATLGIAGPAGSAPPPQGRTYFSIFLGLETNFRAGVDCLRFTATEVCSSSGYCGTWTMTESGRKVSAIAFEWDYEHDGQRVQIDGHARIDGHGKKSTLAAAARLRAGAGPVNYGFLGRPTGPQACLELLNDWTRRFPPDQGERNPACVERANFGHRAASPYILPYPVGVEYLVGNTYCTPGGHHHQLAYDFVTPVGSAVVAARAGVVVGVREDQPDTGTETDPNIHNRVNIEHDDGTMAFYAHLLQNGVLVEVGQRVEAGQLIAYNGNSGNTGGVPHLHFGVYRGRSQDIGEDLPVNFSNALGPLDERGGLLRGVFYKALPPSEPTE